MTAASTIFIARKSYARTVGRLLRRACSPHRIPGQLPLDQWPRIKTRHRVKLNNFFSNGTRYLPFANIRMRLDTNPKNSPGGEGGGSGPDHFSRVSTRANRTHRYPLKINYKKTERRDGEKNRHNLQRKNENSRTRA